MYHNKEALCNPVVGIKVCEMRAFKLYSIVGDVPVRNSISVDDVLYLKDDHFC